jgi:hypothetical protein
MAFISITPFQTILTLNINNFFGGLSQEKKEKKMPTGFSVCEKRGLPCRVGDLGDVVDKL